MHKKVTISVQKDRLQHVSACSSLSMTLTYAGGESFQTDLIKSLLLAILNKYQDVYMSRGNMYSKSLVEELRIK